MAGQVLVWFLLGFAFYACLYAALAALVSRQEEVQNVTAPLSILLVGSFFLAIAALNSPDGGLAQGHLDRAAVLHDGDADPVGRRRRPAVGGRGCRCCSWSSSWWR